MLPATHCARRLMLRGSSSSRPSACGETSLRQLPSRHWWMHIKTRRMMTLTGTHSLPLVFPFRGSRHLAEQPKRRAIQGARLVVASPKLSLLRPPAALPPNPPTHTQSLSSQIFIFPPVPGSLCLFRELLCSCSCHQRRVEPQPLALQTPADECKHRPCGAGSRNQSQRAARSRCGSWGCRLHEWRREQPL